MREHLHHGGASDLISRGGISRSRILQDLEGLPIRYSGDPVLPHPAIADWISRRVMNKN